MESRMRQGRKRALTPFGGSIELLAPARSLEIGRAAITCGADAVYIGAERFGARAAAGNSLDDLKVLTAFAHQYYARVYVALNTLLKDDELDEARRLVESLAGIEIDGLIIQDMAFLEMALPPVPLIASTQTHNTTPEKVRFLEAIGFSRVILARELTLAQIAEIRQSTTIELECFVHGALCVGLSGQCYMSYALGGRSGNRGVCAQPCRNRYRVSDISGRAVAADGYHLSLKDLKLADAIGRLLDIGVSSFKIEGRLKDQAYVVNTVAFYHQLLHEAASSRGLRRVSSGTVAVDFKPHPEKSFNRGFTDYNIDGNPKKIGAPLSPKSIGEYLGQVKTVGNRFFELDGKAEVHNADGLCFFNDRQELSGSLVNRVEGRRIYLDKMPAVAPGTAVYRNHDREFQALLAKVPCSRSVQLALRLSKTGGGIRLSASDEDGNRAEVGLNDVPEPADHPRKALETIHKQLGRTGNTIFRVSECTIALDPVGFLAVGTLNRLRRELVARLLQKRAENRPHLPSRGPVDPEPVRYLGDEEGFRLNVLNQKSYAFYTRHGVSGIHPAAESGLDMKGERVMRTRYCLRNQLSLCPGNGRAEPLILTDLQSNRFRLDFDCERCGMDIVYLGKTDC
jgi:23S rRNA 5-hydroxycytidine C2501 synthase